MDLSDYNTASPSEYLWTSRWSSCYFSSNQTQRWKVSSLQRERGCQREIWIQNHHGSWLWQLQGHGSCSLSGTMMINSFISVGRFCHSFRIELFLYLLYAGTNSWVEDIFSLLRPRRVWREWSESKSLGKEWHIWYSRACRQITARIKFLCAWNLHGRLSHLGMPQIYTKQAWKSNAGLFSSWMSNPVKNICYSQTKKFEKKFKISCIEVDLVYNGHAKAFDFVVLSKLFFINIAKYLIPNSLI